MASMLSLTQYVEVGGGHGQRGPGDAGIAEELVADLGADVEDLCTPG